MIAHQSADGKMRPCHAQAGKCPLQGRQTGDGAVRHVQFRDNEAMGQWNALQEVRGSLPPADHGPGRAPGDGRQKLAELQASLESGEPAFPMSVVTAAMESAIRSGATVVQAKPLTLSKKTASGSAGGDGSHDRPAPSAAAGGQAGGSSPDPAVSFHVSSDLKAWNEERKSTPGASDMRSWLLDKTIPPVHDGVQTDESRRSTVHPDGSPKTKDEVFMDSVLQFGHDYEPVILDDYAERAGLTVADGLDKPISELAPGEAAWHNESFYTAGGAIHASLDGVQRNADGTVTTVEVKTGAAKDFDSLKPERRAAYIAQARIEQLIAGADSCLIVYAHRPRGFMQMNKWAIRNVMKKETVDVPVTDEMLEGVKMYDGTSLKDLTLSRLVEEGRKAKAARDGGSEAKTQG